MRIKRMSFILFLFALTSSLLSAQTLSEELIANADIIVDINGSGDYTSVQEGINAIPDNNPDWLVLLVKKGVYYEKVVLNYKKTKVILVGEDVDSTIITHDDYGDKMLVNGDPAVGGHTFSTYTFRADPHGFQAYNISFKNPTTAGQGVAYHSNGDKQLLYHCRILGNQDTYFDSYRTRRYIKDCFIEGGTDFIFGFGVTLFDSCQIQNKSGYTTASATPQYYEFGHVFKDCRLTTPPKGGGFSLGRPWFPYANTMFYECYLPETLNSSGWTSWSGREATCIYQEYNCFGPGSDTMGRVSFGHQLPPSQASRYVTDTILAASNFPSEMGIEVDTAELFFIRHRFEKSGYIARADTILYAGRDTFPEYPTDDFSPEYFDPIYSIINKYTVPFMDSINGKFDIENLYWNGNTIEGFHEESLDYVVELPAEDTLFPVFKFTGTGVSTSTAYPPAIPGKAIVSATSYDKAAGLSYTVYLSQDSAYWSTTPYFFILNRKDTLYLEKGNTHYSMHLPPGDVRASSGKTKGPSGQKTSIERPDKIPGDVVIGVLAPNGIDNDTIYITIQWALGIDEKVMRNTGLEVLNNPVYEKIILKSNRSINEGILFQIFDIQGKLIFSRKLESISSGTTEISIENTSIRDGLYVYRIDTNEGQSMGKFLKMRH